MLYYHMSYAVICSQSQGTVDERKTGSTIDEGDIMYTRWSEHGAGVGREEQTKFVVEDFRL